VSAIGTFSTYGIDDVGLVNSTTLTSHSYFRNLSCVTCECKLPAAPTNQTSTEKAAGKERLERVFLSTALSILKPTAICALLKFNELCSTCSTKFGLAHPKLSIRAFVKRCKDGPIFKLDYDTSINFGILFEILG
jgi:hypothetical protein